jgi:hypothetical protein
MLTNRPIASVPTTINSSTNRALLLGSHRPHLDGSRLRNLDDRAEAREKEEGLRGEKGDEAVGLDRLGRKKGVRD